MPWKQEQFYSKQFLQLLVAKDETAFQMLYEHTVDSFYRFLKSSYRIDEASIQDILSDTFLKIRNNLEYLQEQQNTQSYLWTILRNTSKDYFKKTKEVAFSELDHQNSDEDSIKFEDNIVDPEDVAELFNIQFQSEKIQKAIYELDNKYQEAVVLKFIEGYDNEEISWILNISEDNVRQRISRGLSKLRDILQDQK